MMSSSRVSVLLAACLLLTAGVATAQQEDPLNWIYGPDTGRLGSVAGIEIPEGYQFLESEDTQMLLEWMENPTSGYELGLIMPEPSAGSSDWFVIFEYNPMGYVRDDEKDDLDADAILKGITEGNEMANEERRKRGWGEIHVAGWEQPPFYDEATNNLKWAIRGRSENGESVNFSTRLLGRGGSMSADLVVDPLGMQLALPDYESLLAGFDYTTGNRYAEFREGDKIAKYGLTALIAGGAGALAVKTGFLAKFWKWIVVGLVAVFGFFKRLFARIFGRSGEDATAASRVQTGPPPPPTRTDNPPATSIVYEPPPEDVEPPASDSEDVPKE